MLVVKPWQEPIPLPQREAQPLSQFRLSQHSHEHQMSSSNGGPCGQQPVAANGGKSFAVEEEPTGLDSKVIFLFAGDAPSIPTETAKSWRITAGDSEWGIPQRFLTELDVCQAQNTEKYELKHQAPFHYPSRFSLRRFQSLLHQA